MYNPTSQPIDLSNYILRRTQNGSHWLSTSWIRLSGILPPNETYVLTRQASDASLQECADLSEPDDFLKHNGDDGFKITHIGYLPEALSNDETAWLKMGITKSDFDENLICMDKALCLKRNLTKPEGVEQQNYALNEDK